MKFIKLFVKILLFLFALYGAFSLFRLAQRLVGFQPFQKTHSEEKVGTTELQPVVLIGSGTASLAAAATILEGDVPVVIFEGKKWGGPLNARTMVPNWPGLGLSSGNTILADLRADVEKYKDARFIAREVTAVDFSGKDLLVYLDNGEVVKAQAVIIATGTQKRHLTIPGTEQFASAISYEQSAPATQRTGRSVVIGGGVEAVRKAESRAYAGAHVTLITRGNRSTLTKNIGKMRQQSLDNAVKKGKITVLYSTEVVELLGESDRLTGVRLSTGKIVPADHIAVGIGRIPNSKIFANQLELDKDGWIKLKDHTQATSRPGVFAAGDITGGGYLEGAIAAGDGMKAGKDVLRYLEKL